MLREITLGQYYPVDSVIHRLDPRTKLFGTLVFILSLFFSGNGCAGIGYPDDEGSVFLYGEGT